jgi:DNA helicase IV
MKTYLFKNGDSKMEFNIRKWRKFYDDVAKLAQQLKDSEDRLDRFGVLVRAKNYLSEVARKAIRSEIEVLLEQTSTYLDRCNIAVQNTPLKKI